MPMHFDSLDEVVTLLNFVIRVMCDSGWQDFTMNESSSLRVADLRTTRLFSITTTRRGFMLEREAAPAFPIGVFFL